MASSNPSGSIARITKEIANIQKGSDLSLAVAFKDTDVRHVRALIVGPPDTPYEFGFFEFSIKFGHDYPIKAPSVRCITTNYGRTRFNPNIYNCGKVCLSILGTWEGEPGEQWSSAQGLESVLLSVQSLMSAHPYENEPGFEGMSKKEETKPRNYIAKIRHETIRIAVLQRLETLLDIGEDATLVTPTRRSKEKTYSAEVAYQALTEPWDPFADLLKRRFLWYYDTYAKTIERASSEQRDGERFDIMEFEGGNSNWMIGRFEYKRLEQRLKNVAQALEKERKDWEREGAQQVQQQTQPAVQLAFQFKQLQQRWNQGTYSCAKKEISLPDPTNPFVWNLTLFGKPMSNLDGGVFNITLSIPPNFPEAQPRAKMETPIFHRRVTSAGYLCYFPPKPEEISSHLQAIVAALEDDENPTFDPRAVVNIAAFDLFWGGEEKRKVYHRKLRRSAQESSEF
ncbi:ubiquitin-conjugating enzyme/RWD-like protein [Neohortaea acidophila]|uniref:Ubiquitin-conjugating enzyme E2 Z n=1 Tax=Neohortaea acidophila TaxID=245834 RepID=A0A6A6PMH5_9PEZI|nr:ubiquitin-conjugating enzyme/RWD-like protein [Neohortaea acidophila]KAF2480457.1 ubiquitin-conjugating enzyme/RWD-like protein [Neohortaea acidophila]